MKNATRKLIVYLFIITISSLTFAETIHFKSGKTIEGNIVKETDEYIEIDFQGINLTYYRDEIASIEKRDDLKLYNFKLGKHNVDGNNLEFKFPGDGDNLYCFNLSKWQGFRYDKSMLIIKLYDSDRNILSAAKSICLRKEMSSFGSIAFSMLEISRKNINEVVYFSVSVEDCGKTPPSIQDVGYEPAQNQLEQIYLNFLAALDKKDLEEMKKYMIRKDVEKIETMAKERGSIDDAFTMMNMMSPRNLRNIKEGIKGDEAILSATGTGPFGGEAQITITFKKEDGVWKIDGIATKEGN